jgi:hypothetical protein
MRKTCVEIKTGKIAWSLGCKQKNQGKPFSDWQSSDCPQTLRYDWQALA